MNLWYRLTRLLVTGFLLGVVGLGLVANLPSSRPAQAAITPGSVLLAWGDNQYGQLGDGTTTRRRTSPEPIGLPNGATPVAISAGDFFTLAIGSDGKLYAWGYNAEGELGDGTTNQHNTPEQINLPGGVTPVAIAAGGYHSLAIGSDGNLYAWGENNYGQLGDGTTTQRNSPVVVQLPSGVTPIALAAGTQYNLAIGSDGKLYAWGLGGALGDGTNISRSIPESVSLAVGVTPTAIAAGTDHSLAIGTDGKLYAWGSNFNGELGDGTTDYKSIPEQISLPGGINPTAIAAGIEHSLASGSDGKLYSWGNNLDGQLGDGTTTPRNVPGLVNLPTGVSPARIVAGEYHNLVLGNNGKLYAWGFNVGELGDGTLTSRTSPVLVNLPPGVTPTAFTTRLYHSLAIVPPPSLTINNVTQNEGNGGTTPFQFTVSLSYASGQSITVQYATADNTATVSGNDYQPATGTLTIPPNHITGSVSVRVNGDIQVERDETFAVNLTNPTGATLGSPATGIGTILNDDDYGNGSCSQLVVSSSGDDGSCGTLRYAVLHAGQPPLSSKPKTITINLAAGTTIILKTGLILTNGTSITTTAQCGVGTGNTMLPPITILGVGAGSGDGLTLSSHNSLYGLWVRGFSGVQIKAAPGSSTKIQCVRVSKL